MPNISPAIRNSARTPVAYQNKASGMLVFPKRGEPNAIKVSPLGEELDSFESCFSFEDYANDEGYIPIYKGDTVTLTF